jgi:HAD superfamily hydrolase (TIGR01509 family)
MATINAVLFDMDGVICDTERDGHRVSFNMTFKEFGFEDEWSVEQYHELLQIGGGKERMKHYWKTHGFSKQVPADQIDQLIQDMHKRKTALYVDLVRAGRLPLRPGVHRFLREAGEMGLKRAVCTTSNQLAAMAILESMLADVVFDLVLAGDVVSQKKPDPEIYNLALERLNLKPEEAFAVEDSRNGVLAAKAAGLQVLVTTNGYTEQEDVGAGDIIISCLGDTPADDCTLRKGNVPFDGVLHVTDVAKAFAQ